LENIDHPHRHTIRLREYDYSQKGMYFITICTHERKNILSKIIRENIILEQNKKMKSNTTIGAHCMCPENLKIKLTEIGRIVEQEIVKTSEMRRNIKIENYVIMPNHVHMIISIKSKGTLQCAPTFEKFGTSTSNSIPEIIRAIKGRVTRELNKKYNKDIKLWQRNYYEHVVRNEKELQVTMEYIEYNPFNWKTDPLNNVGAHCNVPKRYKIINKNTKK